MIRLLNVAFAAAALLSALTMQQPASALEFVTPGETQEFDTWDRCVKTPFTDTLLKGTGGSCHDPRQIETFAALTVAAVNNDVESSATALMDFHVSSAGDDTVLDATVSADVAWNGVLFGAGLLGAGAEVQLEMSLVDEDTGTTKGRVVVFQQAQNSTGLKGIDVGGTVFSGSKNVSFPASVVRGHAHSIRIRVTCSAQSGLVGLDVGCTFENNSLGLGLGERYVRWSGLKLTVEQDAIETLNRLETKIDALTAKVDQLLAGQTLSSARQLEIIRILNTPTGLRDLETPPPPPCRGQGC